MKLQSAAFVLGLLTTAYFIAFFALESNQDPRAREALLVSVFPILLLASLLSYLFRYIRWHRLLNGVGSNVEFIGGFAAYLSGFAFTATPGKVGELMRVRYFSKLGVRPWKVIAAFVFERAMDLLVVLLLASFLFYEQRLFYPILAFVLIVLLGVMFFIQGSARIKRVEHLLNGLGFIKLGLMFRILSLGLKLCRKWFNRSDIAVSFLLGLVAWSIVSASFVYLLSILEISGHFFSDFSTYPLAMLAGAASMLPGGIGSTEAAIILLMSNRGVGLDIGLLAALSIRISTLWFAVLCGVVTSAFLELRLKCDRPNLI